MIVESLRLVTPTLTIVRLYLQTKFDLGLILCVGQLVIRFVCEQNAAFYSNSVSSCYNFAHFNKPSAVPTSNK